MNKQHPQWEAFAEFVTTRPANVQALMRDWPPLATVKTKPGIVLLVPAPGVEGHVESYFEDGTLGIAAPLVIPHPEHGYGNASPGDLLCGPVDPEQLDLVSEGEWSREDVRAALAET